MHIQTYKPISRPLCRKAIPFPELRGSRGRASCGVVRTTKNIPRPSAANGVFTSHRSNVHSPQKGSIQCYSLVKFFPSLVWPLLYRSPLMSLFLILNRRPLTLQQSHRARQQSIIQCRVTPDPSWSCPLLLESTNRLLRGRALGRSTDGNKAARANVMIRREIQSLVLTTAAAA